MIAQLPSFPPLWLSRFFSQYDMHPRWHASGNNLALRHFNEVGSLYKPSCKNSRKRQKWQQAGSLLKKCWYDLKIFEAGTEWENTKGRKCLHNQVLLPRAPSHDKKSTLCPMPLTTQHSNAAKFTLHKLCKRNCTCCESAQVGEGTVVWAPQHAFWNMFSLQRGKGFWLHFES